VWQNIFDQQVQLHPHPCAVLGNKGLKPYHLTLEDDILTKTRSFCSKVTSIPITKPQLPFGSISVTDYARTMDGNSDADQ
jgi:hypothetical protein